MTTTDQRNAETSRKEVADFMRDAPDRYFAYHAGIATRVFPRDGYRMPMGARITTWTGDTLATVTETFQPYVSNMGDRRQNFRARAINGATYSGTAYLDAGDYVRMRKVK